MTVGTFFKILIKDVYTNSLTRESIHLDEYNQTTNLHVNINITAGL
jgi:hypothetical protein